MPKATTAQGKARVRAAAAKTAPARVSAAVSAEAGTSSSARSLAVLAAVAGRGRAISLAELAATSGLPKATAHRLCEQLVGSGHLARDFADRSFVAGPALRALAYDTLNHGTARGLRHEVLAGLVGRIDETCNFTTLDGTGVLYLDRVEAPWPLRLTLDVGSHVPLHCTASGKLFLAAMAQPERDALIARIAMPRMTVATLTTAKALRAECDAIAAAGYSCDREEFVAGLIAVAVPVTDAAGAVRAAIAVHAPTARMSLRVAVSKLPALKAAAARMRALL